MRVTSAWRFGVIPLALSLLSSFAPPARAQQPPGVSISWQVKSRFRLFKNEEDFKYMAANYDAGGVLASENRLAAATGGNGWARRIVNGLCVDSDGQLLQSCTRDYSTNDPGRETFTENYLAPAEHAIGVTANGTAADAKCTWKFVTEDANAKDKDAKATVKRDQPCSEEILVRVAYSHVTHVQLFVAAAAESGPPTATTDVNVRDVLIVGLGDSTAAGDGNPDRHWLLLWPLPKKRHLVPAEPRRLQRQSCLRQRPHRRHKLDEATRTLDECRMSSFSLQLSTPTCAGAGNRKPASRRHLHTPRLYRRYNSVGNPRPAARPGVEL
jgi:hypothetical protein